MIRKARWKALALCFVFILSNLAAPGFFGTAHAAGAAPGSGSGTPADPYIVSSPTNLVWMGENFATIKDKSFRQVGDINMTGVSFEPIGNGGTSYTDPMDAFSGTYDGQAFAITNLTINSNKAYIGLFQSLSGTVENVRLVNASITNTSTSTYATAVGIAATTNTCTIRNCSVSGTIAVTGAANYSYAAGFAGNFYGSIYDSACTAAISNANGSGYAAGVAAYTGSNTGEIKRCYFAGSLGGPATKGGIVGNYYQGTQAANVYLSSAASWANGSDYAAGQPSNAGAASCSDAQMKQATTYTALGWDFTSLWKISEGAGYPQHITAPGKPAGVAAAFGDGTATVSWSAASRASGYRVCYGTAPGVYGNTVDAAGTSATLTGLTNNQTYYIAVKALHSAEEGTASDETTVVPHKTVTDLAAAPDSGRINLTFTAAGADTVELQQSTGGAFAAVAGVSLTGASTSAAVTGLTNGTEYSFRLRLVYGTFEYFSNTAAARAGNPVNSLSALTVSGAALTPAFSPSVLAYSASVGSNIASVTVTATAQGALSSIAINGSPQASGSPKTVAVASGENTITIVVTAQNGITRSYALTVTRAYSGATLPRIADAWWDTWGGTTMYAGHYEPDVENAALKFDLRGYTDELLGATLKIYVNNNAPPDGSSGEGAFDLYGADDGWTTSAPAAHDPTALYSVVGKPASGWKAFDVTSYVQTQYARDGVASFYFAGRDLGGENDIAFYSPAASNAGKQPFLELTFVSSDARLAGITVGGVSLPGFSPDVDTYSYVAPHDADLSALVFASVVNDLNATQGSWAYNSTTKAWSVTVTAQNGATRTYTVNVSAAPSADATLKGLKLGGADLSGFDPATLNYTLNVAHGTDIAALVFTSEPNDHLATQGPWTYAAATKTWSVVVTAEDGVTTKTYAIAVHELPNNDATLSAITVGGSPLTGFAPGTLNYTIDVPHGTNIAGLVIAGTLSDPAASQGAWTYAAATKKWSVTVTAEDGATTKTYAITVHELPNNDATLSAITVGGSPLAGFASGTLSYTIDVPHGTNIAGLMIAGTLSDPAASQGAWSYAAATKTWSVTVTAEDGVTTKTYSIAVNELPSTDATLKSIKLGGAGLSGFSPATLNYTLNVAHGTDIAALVFVSETNDPMATQSAWTYAAATKTWSVTVTAENGTTTRTYAIAVHELPSADATLKSIKVGVVDLPGFSPATLSYTYNVPHGTDASLLVFTSETNDHMATQGAWTYTAATKTWSVTVTAEDGSTVRTYAVAVHVLPNNDAALKSIKVGGTDLPGFAPATLSYILDVPAGTNNAALVFTSETNDPAATQGAWAYIAAQKKWSVTVTAEDGATTRTYAVTIRQPASHDATLSSIRVGGSPLTGFAPGTLSYAINVAHGTNIASLVFASTTADPAATQSAWAYAAATKKWSVTVTAEDGTTTRTYTVTVTELPSNNAALSYIRVDGVAVSGFLATKLTYTVNVTHGTNPAAVAMTAQTADANATKSAWTYTSAQKKWSITVTAQDGVTKKTYTVTVNVLPSSNATLSEIRLDGVKLTGFDPLVTSYTLTVPYGTDRSELEFTAEAADENATVDEWTYSVSTGKWSVVVTAENGTSKRTYVVTVLLGPAPSTTPSATSSATASAAATTTAPAASGTAAAATGTPKASPSPAPTAAPTKTPTDTAAPTLNPDAALHVTFVLSDGEQPIAGASLELDGVMKRSGADGTIKVDLSAGTIAYRAEAVGFERATGSVAVAADGSVYCVVLARKGMVMLHSGGPGGKPAAGGSAVLIASQTALPQSAGTLLVVDEIEAQAGDGDAVRQSAGSQYQIARLFDIYLLVDAKKVQPNQPVRIGVPVPQDLLGRKLAIVRINDDGTVTTFDTVQTGDMLFFTADHFSKYAIVIAGSGMPTWLIAVLAAAAAMLLVVIAILIIRRKKKKA